MEYLKTLGSLKHWIRSNIICWGTWNSFSI